MILQRILVKLFHIEEAIENNTRAIVKKNKELTGLREEQRVHDNALEAARTEQAKARTAVMQKEKGIKKAEKALDGKVCRLYSSSSSVTDSNILQKPELVTIEAHITHATRKMNNAEKSKEEVVKDLKTRQEKFDRLQTELKSVRRDANKAQGL